MIFFKKNRWMTFLPLFFYFLFYKNSIESIYPIISLFLRKLWLFYDDTIDYFMITNVLASYSLFLNKKLCSLVFHENNISILKLF
jgi:hypothetical protein